MNYAIDITSQESEQLKDIVKVDYVKKFDVSGFEKDWESFKKLPLFSAMGTIYDEENEMKPEFAGFSKSVHYIMRLVAQYHINQAMKALKYDTTKDVNLATDNGSNIGTPGRIAKVWGGDKLDSSVFSEYGDGRWVKTPRLAVFPVESITVTGKFKGSDFVTDDENEYKVSTEIKGITPVLKFVEADTERVYYTDKISTDKISTDLDEEITLELFPDQEIVVKTIEQNGLSSVCSHHFLPFFITGKNGSGILIAYKPYKYLLGISKITRLVAYALNRPSLQEGSTDLIFKEIAKACGTQDVFVGLTRLVHTCELTRGAGKETTTTTEKAGGVFKNENLRKNIIDSL